MFCAGELYNLDPAQHRRGMVAATGDKYTSSTAENFLNGDLDGCLWSRLRAHHPKAAIGFKALYEHLGHPNGRLEVAVARDRDLRILHLVRSNPFHCMASWWLAQRSGRWLAEKWPGFVTNESTVIDPIAAEHYLRHRQISAAWVEGLQKTHVCLRVRYEDLVKDHLGEIERIYNWLEVPAVKPVQSRYLKQDARPLSAKIRNIEQLRQHFAGTEWSAFLDDKEHADLPW